MVNRYDKVKFVHHRCCTIEEFRFSINRWKTKSFQKQFPILYIGFHGAENQILIGKEKITLDEFAELLGDSCQQSVIHFGSCSTLDIHKRYINRFLSATKTLAIMGYKHDVDWLESAALEIQIMSTLQSQPFDSKGLEKINQELYKENKRAINKLQFKLFINEEYWFPRSRKHK
jgi:hypothetical protein